MAGIFIPGEQKVRPGAYFNIQKKGDNAAAGVVNGVTAVVFKSNFGPLCTCEEISAEDGYEPVFGNDLTTDAIREAISGGARTILACRLGNGGTQADITLNESGEGGAGAVTLTALYPGNRAFTATIRTKLADTSVKECIIYDGTAEFEKVEFTAGTGEALSLAEAMATSKKFKAQVLDGKSEAILANVSQASFSPGEDPAVTVQDYSDAFAQLEPYEFNTICVDTEDTEVHLLLAAFLDRIYNAGSLAQAVVAEKYTVDLETRMFHAAAFNDEKMHYVLNAHVNEQGKEIDGYQTAARVAGMIGACASNSSLTHTVINGFTQILERLTNTQIVAAEKKGCIVLSCSSSGQIWIDSAINTLIVPADDQDDGWKKIRRVKTRFELIRRVNVTADSLIGKVDNDSNGRNTVISQVQAIGDAMVAESKLVSCKVTESALYTADGDSAWFDIDVIDKDSMEHIYMTFKFQFSTNAE